MPTVLRSGVRVQVAAGSIDGMPEAHLQDDLTLEFVAPLWRWQSRREFWTFVSLPEAVTDDVRALAGDLPRGFGAVKVHARIGGKQWWTSVFPQDADGPYVLPVKRSVRDAGGLQVGDEVAAWVQLHP